jgi:predicted small lipoprotein YifL
MKSTSVFLVGCSLYLRDNHPQDWRLFMKSCWAQYLLWLVIAVLGTGSALSACGQKGALYQPEPSAAKEPSAHNMPAAQQKELSP